MLEVLERLLYNEIERRIKAAVQLLKSGKLSVEEIAEYLSDISVEEVRELQIRIEN